MSRQIYFPGTHFEGYTGNDRADQRIDSLIDPLFKSGMEWRRLLMEDKITVKEGNALALWGWLNGEVRFGGVRFKAEDVLNDSKWNAFVSKYFGTLPADISKWDKKL